METISLTKVFSDWWGRAKVYAVDDLNLQIRHNEVFGLLGPNGSGKTTTIKMLLGLLHPTKGHALLLGGDGTDPKINRRVGFLPEESYLYRFLNARETLDFYGRLFKLDAKVRKMRIEALLEMVGLRAVASRPIGTYSKGMARRIGLAQALINDPDLLILDEPTTGLDPIGTRQIKDLILKLAERGKTILLCSHLLADVEDVCDRIAILYGGKVQAEGRVRELLQQNGKRQIVTSAVSDGTIEKIRRLLAEEHAECEITSPMEKLETFFIHTVAQAQQQAKPTSGAVSTTQIGDFLMAEKSQASALDKLVAAPVSQDKPTAPRTEPIQPVETPVAQPDRDLLSRLTRSAGPPQTEQVAPVKPSPADTAEPRDNRQINRSVLDALTGQTAPPATEKPHEPRKDGEARHE
ncbi:MAG TPA: ATP-binding cassette domain-containing protein [Sedimentisphaerales bacterium]|nr:ATP-binding cassette domain-containing protein [Sedimentisphaerales bacterium]HRV48516.1 ATP-binding cassette domain-containing protein [Sedimentisphaerales bacterium]